MTDLEQGLVPGQSRLRQPARRPPERYRWPAPCTDFVDAGQPRHPGGTGHQRAARRAIRLRNRADPAGWQGPVPCAFSATPISTRRVTRTGAFALVSDLRHRAHETMWPGGSPCSRSTAEGVDCDRLSGTIVSVNPALHHLTGIPSEALGRNPRFLQSGRPKASSSIRGLWGELAASGQWQGEIWNRRLRQPTYKTKRKTK